MLVLQGSEESTEPPIFSDFDERKTYKSGKVTKHMEHIGVKDFFFFYSLCVVMVNYTDGEHC